MNNLNPNNDPVQLLAATLFSETRDINDSRKVASVIVNRAKDGRFGADIPSVILQPQQFSGVGGDEFNKAMSGKLTAEEESIYKQQIAIASAAWRGNLPDDAKGAKFYFNPALANPSWAKKMVKVDSNKFHTYYKEK